MELKLTTETSKPIKDNQKKESPTKAVCKDRQSDEQENVSKELDACKASMKEWQEKCMRLSADFENFKRRTANEQKIWAELVQLDLLTQLLSIVDNFDRAMEHKEQPSEQEMASWVDGIAMIYNDFVEFFKKVGVKEVSYDEFDPTYHEALMQVDSDEHESGQIVAVVQKGYMLNDRVIRPAKVSVAK